MLLAIDAGNTNLVFALLREGKIQTRWRIATDARRTADQYAVWLHQLLEMEGYGRDSIDAVIIGTVVPRALHNLKQLSRKYFGVESLVAGQGPAAWGGEIQPEHRHSVGADRALNVIAAHHAYPETDIIVIDFGTATTFEVVDFAGVYQGGIIAPGINLSLDALVAAAAKLPRIAIEAPRDRNVIGRTTEEQMHIGIFWGYVAMIEGLVKSTKAQIGRPAKVIGTGGLATLFHESIDVFDAVEPDLTIQGLWYLFERTKVD